MGTPDFACTLLQKLDEAGFPIVAVFAQPDKPVGRGKKMQSPPVAEYAKQKDIPLFQPHKVSDPTSLETLKNLAPDYIIVAAYGKILPDRVLNAAKKECLNVHASLLPKYRGAAPIQYAILNGDNTTGVAIMRVVKELDAGPVFLDKEIPIDLTDTTLTLTAKLADLGGEALLEALNKIENENLKPIAQNPEEVSFAHKITKDMAKMNWNDSAQKLFNQVRALQPWPVAETHFQNHRIRVHSCEVLNSDMKKSPGTIVEISKKGLDVATGSGILRLLECQADGKKRMPATALANGMHLEEGQILGI